MDRSSKHPQRPAAIELWRIIVLVAGALCFALLAIGRVPSRDTHEAILTSLREIDVNHASLQRDILQARVGLLQNYDPLVDSIVNLHAAISRLRHLLPQSEVDTSSTLDDELTKLEASVDSDERLVERFKRDNALLQNSLSLATLLLSDLEASRDPAIVQALGSASDLGNIMMRFANQPDDRLAATIEGRLAALTHSQAAEMADVKTYVAHANMILKTLPAVDDTIEAIQASRTSREAQLLQKQYLDAYGVVSLRSSWVRVFLGSVSFLLCCYVAVLIYRLRKQTNRLTQQLNFENLAADIKKRFADDNEAADVTMDICLGMLATFFDASRYSFAAIDNDTRDIREIFGNTSDGSLHSIIQRFAADVSDSMASEELHGDRFFYHNLQQREIQAFPEGGLSAGSVVATKVDNETLGLLLLEHREVRRKPSADDIRLLGHGAIVLAQCIEARRERRQKRKLEERLEHAQRLEAVGTLAGGIAHEFNNVLGAILGYGELALQQRRNLDRTKQYVREIVSSGQRAKHIVDQILTFSRKRERISNPFDVKEVIDNIVPLIRLSLRNAVSVEARIAEDLPAVLGNPIEIQQVLMNLCTNAAHAIADIGAIDIRAKRVTVTAHKALSHGDLPAGNYVLISVTDSGSGIPSAVLSHIFEPFFTTKAGSGGTGLGLAVVHGHVTGMNGKIDVRSRPQIGTRFRLYFPSVPEAPVPLAQFFDEKAVPLGNGEVVLIALSDANLCLMYEEKIAALGYEPIGFSDIGDVRRWFEACEQYPDLMLLDLDLWPAAPNLKEVAEEFAPVATLFIADVERANAHVRIAANPPFLRKPISSNALATALFTTINSHMVGK
ncbi:two-component system VirA-like sensor kinase [Rhizobium sp. P38BS-XIX]|uniref:two-component system VirA-like sensor kinase n=1 Tax=Rhizobium sp. P38BS-XIX TaxID=2726740 RepID=UPI0014563F36|nr:two-component system VirA-like sensor kinase [Rhizobium sp. P38BS-XIX]NLS00753.1 two-component system VirA-like sensor kinase [Rhizobium sp. P38BS-XIX]